MSHPLNQKDEFKFRAAQGVFTFASIAVTDAKVKFAPFIAPGLDAAATLSGHLADRAKNSPGFGAFDQTSTSSALPKADPFKFAKNSPSAVTKQSLQGFNDRDMREMLRQDQILSRKLGF